MIKAKGRSADGTVRLLFGLSHENLDRLRAGQPILIDLTELEVGIVGMLTIFAGVDEATMERTLREACGPLPPPRESKDGHIG